MKKLQFGSKIDSSTSKREDLHTVKEIISSEKIILDNGLVVCLLGVREIPKYREQAIEFLKVKFKKHKNFYHYVNITLKANPSPNGNGFAFNLFGEEHPHMCELIGKEEEAFSASSISFSTCST